MAYLLLPAFFIYSGLNTQLTLIFDSSTLLMAGIVLVVSFAAKFGAVGLAARWQGMSWYEAGSMGALANARGLMELILLNIGLEAGLISGKLYTILAVMTIITTFVATPLQRLFERRLARTGAKFGPEGRNPSVRSPPPRDRRSRPRAVRPARFVCSTLSRPAPRSSRSTAPASWIANCATSAARLRSKAAKLAQPGTQRRVA